MLNKYRIYFMKIFLVTSFIALFFWGNIILFIYIYICVSIFISLRTIMAIISLKLKTSLIIAYMTTLSLQIVAANLLFVPNKTSMIHDLFVNTICSMIILLPIIISRYIVVGKYSQFYLPSIQEVNSFSFTQVKNKLKELNQSFSIVGDLKTSLSSESINEIFTEVSRNDSFKYTNDGHLTDEYFNEVEKSMNDEAIYIIISNTGTAVSDLISLFTKKQYNHASLSFDRELTTIISYNGGHNVYPPGLNAETLQYFHNREDSSIIVYRLPCTVIQKQMLVDKIRTINIEGSAYNMLGLITKHSYKPNIMFCSQFIYAMLKHCELDYFDKKELSVTPTDLVELDYHRKLQFEYELLLKDTIHAKK